MNITNVTVTKVAEESTENADYQLEYSIVNDALTRVHASIRKKDTDGSGNAPQIGIIMDMSGQNISSICRLISSRFVFL